MASVRKRKCAGKGGQQVEVWVVNWTDETGKRRLHTPRPNTKEAADKIARKLKPGSPLNVSFLPYTIADLSRAYLKVVERRYADEEITRERLLRQWYIVDKLILPKLGKMRARDLKPLGVQAWVDEMRDRKSKPVSAETVHNAISTLRKIMTEGVRLEVVTRNVIADAPPHRAKLQHNAIEVPTRTEIEKIIANCTGSFGALIKTAIFTGMRQGEIRALRWSSVDEDCRIANVNSSAGGRGDIRKTKTKAGIRTLPIAPGLSAELLSLKTSLKPKISDFVFSPVALGERGAYGHLCKSKPSTPSAIQKRWQTFLKSIGVRPLRFHSLRHAAATLYIETGLPPQRVKYLMGHASIQMTFDTYGYLFPEDRTASDAAAKVELSFKGDLVNG